MSRSVACLLFVLAALASAVGQGKPRRAASLSKRQCAAICAQMTRCMNLDPDKSATTVETLICVDDCVFESKDEEHRPGWLCASRAEGCEALKACNAGGRTKAPK